MLERGGSIELIGVGYAGAPRCLNNPMSERSRACGPLPKGRYLVERRSHPRFAYPAFRLTPLEGTEVYGRSGFWIHGDNRARNRSASTGCIVLDRHFRHRIALAIDVRGSERPVLTVV